MGEMKGNDKGRSSLSQYVCIQEYTLMCSPGYQLYFIVTLFLCNPIYYIL